MVLQCWSAARNVLESIGEDGARWECGVRLGGAEMQYFRGDCVGTLVGTYCFLPKDQKRQ